MATQLQNGKQQFLDVNGDPLVGGKVYFYIPTTSTPKDTWTDADETILNTNPVILDGNGQAVIWGSGSYRQVLTDSADVVIWDQIVTDSVSAVESGFTVNNSQIPDGEIAIAKLEDVSNNIVLGRIDTGAGAVEELPVGDDNGEFVRWTGTKSLTFSNASDAAPSISFDENSGTGLYSYGPNSVGFATNGVEGFRCGESFGRGDWTNAMDNGNGVGDFPMVRITDVNTLQVAASNETSVMCRLDSDGPVVQYRRDDVDVGSVSVTGAATSFNTSSDYRLKEDIKDIENAMEKALRLSPREFTFKATGDRVTGFLAHELQELLPNAVTGEKDGAEMQSADYSKVVPLLSAALKEAINKINELEARISKLEN